MQILLKIFAMLYFLCICQKTSNSSVICTIGQNFTKQQILTAFRTSTTFYMVLTDIIWQYVNSSLRLLRPTKYRCKIN